MVLKVFVPDHEHAVLRLFADLIEEKHLAMSLESEDASVLVAGRLRLDTRSQESFLDDQPTYLNAKEYLLLELLMRNAGRVLTHAEILQQVWGYEDGHYLVKNTVMRLRHKLGGSAEHIRSVRNRGYLFKTEAW